MSREQTVMEAIQAICEHLTERTATLFLGAGVNAGIYNNAGEEFPLGQQLTTWICRDLLDEPTLNIGLDEAAEMARYRFGAGNLNQYLYDKFSTFQPGTAHLTLVQIPWDVIYTTNYDLLIEQAALVPTVRAAGTIRPVFSTSTDLATFSEEDILYYKLHGSVDYANSEEGRLIITKEDYQFYEVNRRSLFGRLERDLLSHTIVFIGYSLRDSNLRQLLEDCRKELGIRALPLSFAVRPDFSPIEETFWREKYNVQLIAAEADTFLATLQETWISQNRIVLPLESRKAKEYLHVGGATRFPKVSESFYRVRPNDCTGSSEPKQFFQGREPTWADIRDQVPPKRDIYWTILETLFPELAEPTLPVSVYLVTGSAGTGKTTTIRTIAFDLAKGFNLPVVIHIPGTPFDARVLAPLVDENNPQRIIVILHHAAEYSRTLERFVEQCKELHLPVTLILEERKNQWLTLGQHTKAKLLPGEFELGSLSKGEIGSILDALNRFGCLGKLTGADRTFQEDHFTSLADKDLLVALRELTSPGNFDDIIRDEFSKIPEETAKAAYVYVSALGQIGLSLRYETLVHVLNLRYEDLRSKIFIPTEGILITGESTGRSRHNIGFRLAARHPIIASIIFAQAATDDDARFKILNEILSGLDPGFLEDKRILDEIIRRRELVAIFVSYDKRRAIYERLATILPKNPYVLQHRSILERELSNPSLAIEYARAAVKIERGNPGLLDTLGHALEHAARSEPDSIKRQAELTEATHLFQQEIAKDPSNPYGYIGIVNIIRQAIERESDPEKRSLLQASVLSTLEDAYEATGESPIIGSELAFQKNQLGTSDVAIQILKAGLDKKPSDNRIRDVYIRIELERGNLTQALKLALDGAKLDPTSWRLQRHIARIKRQLNEPIEAVMGYYEAALRHRKGDLSLLVELGAFLFTHGRYLEANESFREAKEVRVPTQEKTRVRERWTGTNGKEIVFRGKVKTIRGAAAWAIAIPQNFEVFFWRTREDLSSLVERDQIQFVVRFNGMGPIAAEISKV